MRDESFRMIRQRKSEQYDELKRKADILDALIETFSEDDGWIMIGREDEKKRYLHFEDMGAIEEWYEEEYLKEDRDVYYR